MTGHVLPPRVAVALLARALPADQADMIVGDLTELYADRVDAGYRANRLWFWTQTAAFLLGFATGGHAAPEPPARRHVMERLTAALRHATRRLVYEWRYSAAVVFVLAVGIGPAAAMLSVADAVLLRPLDYANPDELAIVRLDLGQIQNHPGLSQAEVRDLRETSGLFDDVQAASRRGEVSMGEASDLQPLTSIAVTPGLFPMLGATPVVGRAFTEADAESGAPMVILDFGAWQRLFDGDETIVGRTIAIDGSPAEVVGVLPPGFRLALGRGVPEPLDVYMPLRLRDNRNFWAFPTLVRVAEGVSLEQANAGLVALTRGLTGTYPDAYADADLTFALHGLKDDMMRESRPAIRAAMAGVLLLLLIAVANAAALVVARLRTRDRDLAIRSAMGAGRSALVTEVLSESVILSVAGAAAGAALGLAGVVGAARLMPRTVPRWDSIGLGWDLPVYAGLFALVGLVFAGLLPVWKVSRGAPWRALASEGDRVGRAEGALPRLLLVGTQVALTVVLAFGAIQLIRSATLLDRVDVGYDARVLAFRVPLDSAAFGSMEDRAAAYRRVQEALGGLPRVESVGATSHLPLSGSVALDAFTSDLTGGIGGDQTVANYHAVLPGYFDALRMPFVAGRDVTDAEFTSREPVIVIDETAARLAFGDDDPIGRTMRLGWGIADSRVVGVVRHARSIEVGRDVRPQIYAPFSSFAWSPLYFTVRADGDPLQLRDAVTLAVRQAGTGRAVSGFQLLTENVESATSTQRSVASLVSLLALSAGLLSAVGLYAVIAYLVHQRRRATAIRAALGASRLQLVRHHLRTTAIVTVVAVPAGLALAAVSSSMLEALLYGVSVRDTGSLALAAATALAASLVGTLVPAMRAARTDAGEVLREGSL